MKVIAFVLVLVAWPAFAEPTQQQPSADERIAKEIGTLVITVHRLQDVIAQLQQQLASSQAELKRLTDEQKAK